jgi:hypothetical protein
MKGGVFFGKSKWEDRIDKSRAFCSEALKNPPSANYKNSYQVQYFFRAPGEKAA